MVPRSLGGVLRGRGLVLLPAAAFAVHQLRYTLAYGSDAGSALATQGHPYLTSLAPWIALLLAFGAGSLLLRTAHALVSGRDDHPRRSFLELWALASASLTAIYVVQELLESWFAAGHPDGFAGLFGHGGWWAIVAAIGAGAAVAALLRVACSIVSVARQLAPPKGFLVLVSAARRLQPVSLAPRSPLASAAAGRAPPAAQL